MTSQISLDLFAVVWNRSQGMPTPAIHLRILRWLEASWNASDTRLLLMAFRAGGKSTLVGIFCAWLIFTRPHIRIMVIAADDLLARKMVRNVKRMIERHPLTFNLKPQESDQWASDRFTVEREVELRDPTMLARGITSNVTGSRADVIIFDDVEVPNTCMTAEGRADLRDRLNESRFILVPQGTQLYVGTPHCYDTIYTTDEREAFLGGFKDLRLPILNDAGESVWPERFSLDEINAMWRQVGPNKFASQMMLQPVNIANGRLNPEQLSIYDHDLDYSEAQQKPILSLDGKRMVSCSSWWDPAFGSAKGDGSVWALVFSDAEGHYHLHHVAYIKTDLRNSDDEATQQCRIVAQLCKQFYVPSVTVEINGIGRFLPAILRREMKNVGAATSVVEHSARVPKAQRILEAYDAVMAAQALSIHRSVTQTPFMAEMREWRPSATNGRDDGLDAVAGALLQEPIRIAVGKQMPKRYNWQATSDIFQAEI